MKKKFQDECKILSQLKHPNIVQFLGTFHGTGGDVLLMEYMHMALDKCLEQYPSISLPVKLSILQDVTCGLLYLHSLAPPIIHRDLTAANVLLTPDMRAKIADYGVSKVFDLQQARKHNHTKAPGAPGHMPPEALTRVPDYNVKLDIFSFGVLSLYIANHQYPEMYEVPMTHDVIHRVQIHRRKHWLDMMGEGHPLYPVVIQCLQDLPDRRPTTKELWKMIDDLCVKYKMGWKNTLDVSNTYMYVV